jgi:hypothetical protein
MKKKFSIIAISISLLSIISFNSKAADTPTTHYNIWPSIPFQRGADLCKYKDAYGETRTEYMKKMVGLAKDLLGANADATEALKMLTAFNEMYDRNQEMAMKSGNMDITLESTLKSYVDQLYRENTPRVKKLSFTNVNDIVDVINNIKYGRRDELLTKRMLSSLDFIGYGTYALAPNCRGDMELML